ncbi:MAG TPA: sugar ABC transporter permease [Armatimonadota bacterium]|jgi:multiple sugar transport system permease protein
MARFYRRWEGFLFILPFVIGFLCFTLGPLIASGYYSLVKYDMLNPNMQFVGMQNYVDLFSNPDFAWSLGRTAMYAIMAVPATMVGSLAVAMLLNQKVPGIAVFRTIYYLPAVTSGVAMLTLWRLLFRPETGLVDTVLAPLYGWLHITNPASFGWLSNPKCALQTMVLLSVWGLGSGMIIYLAGLQGIPDHLYEAAELDGAGAWKKFRNVTLPMLTPTIFFNLVMNTIAAFQAFDQAYILSTGTGGPSRALLMYVLLLYNTAFKYLKIGPASAMAWVLFVIILVLTGINFLMSKRWVHYD